MIDTPYLDGIRTHRGKVKSVIRPPFYLQATMAGSHKCLSELKKVLDCCERVITHDVINICYPLDLCYSKCRFSTDRIKQGDLVFNVYYLCK